MLNVIGELLALVFFTLCLMLIPYTILDTLDDFFFIIKEPLKTYISLIIGFFLYCSIRSRR